MDYSLEVAGGNSPVTLSYADLKAMNFTELKDISTVNSVGTVTAGNFAGVPMTAIIEKAGLPAGDVSYKVSAADGYNIVYNSEQMSKSVLAFTMNGSALTNNINDDKNVIRMVVPGETKNMWMKLPAKVEIIKGAAKPAALSITGMVDTKKYLSIEDLKATGQVTGTFAAKNNLTVNVTGASLNALLDSATIQSGAKTAVFSSGDEKPYTQNISISDIRASKNALIALDANGTLTVYVENLSTKSQVRNLSTIKVV
jgi:DMSO/TMAO reductase YedYZ molybdopterin-dependent catalytic subunit